MERDPLVAANNDKVDAIKTQYHKPVFRPCAKGATLDVVICHSSNMPKVVGMRVPGCLRIFGPASQNNPAMPTNLNKGLANLRGIISTIPLATVNIITRKKNFWPLALAGKGGRPNVDM